VTIEEFICSMEAASGKDLFQFRRWYTQAGTPTLAVRDRYDPETQTYTLAFKQTCPPTPERFEKEPFHIPVRTALFGKNGQMVMKLKGEPIRLQGRERRERMLEVVAEQQKFVFENIPEKPVPSILRNFSAPVRLDYPYSRDDLIYLMIRDTDGFNRWEASQQLALKVIKGLMLQYQAGKPFAMDPKLVEAYQIVLQDSSLDPAIVALMLNLPSEDYIAEQMKVVDVDAIHHARQFARKKLAQELSNTFLEIYQLNQDLGIYRPNSEAIAMRSLKNTALSYLMLLEIKTLAEICLDQYNKSTNMTDTSAAMVALINCEAEFLDNAKEKALRMFYRRWQNETLVVNHWLAVQAGCVLPGTIKTVKELEKHESFDIKNPNKVRSLIGVFCNQNHVNFHAKDGEGYRYLTDKVMELNAINPQIASRLLSPFVKWKRYDKERQELILRELERIARSQDLSKDVYEVVTKTLAVA
jgi:aminopeptidase N